jgi:short-subunit dehydrogenase
MHRRILITGASSGIGRALAVELAEPGTELILTGRRSDALADVVVSAGSRGAEVETHVVELSSERDVIGFGEKVASQDSGLDVVISNAGVIKLEPLATSDVANLDWHYHVNLRAPVLLVQTLLPRVAERHGQFVFVNSAAGLIAHKGAAFYAATKHGLKAVADSLREEVSQSGITVLSVFPSRTNTPMQQRVLEMEGATADLTKFLRPDAVARIISRAMERCRNGEINNVSIRPGEESHVW